MEEATNDTKEKFEWDTFLESHEIEPAPNCAFQHVDSCQQNLLEDGMLVEVQQIKSQSPTFWLAYISLKCGPFVRLKYVGQEDSDKEFWADPSSVEIKPVGYSSHYNLDLKPPFDVKSSLSSVMALAESLISQYRTSDCKASLLSPAQQMKPDVMIEIEDLHESCTVWVGSIVRNVGGRILVNYVLPPTVSPTEYTEVWIFCLSQRVHAFGWAAKLDSWNYKPPKKVKALASDDLWQEMARKFKESAVEELNFNFHKNIESHSFTIGAKVEVLPPWNPTSLISAKVVEVVDCYRFVVQFDSNEMEYERMACIAGESVVLPEPTQPKEEGDKSSLAKELGFARGMAVEAVNPWKRDDICVALITDIQGSLLKVRLEQTVNAKLPEIIVAVSSYDLFPVGWCESHGYPLKGPPNTYTSEPQNHDDEPSAVDFVPQPEEQSTSVSYWCPKIYFNFRCFSGPLLSKVRIAALPRSVGPGPIVLVLKEVLSLLINGAYKPGGVLKQLQGEPGAPIPKGTQLEPLKAKYKQTTYRASVPIACTAAEVPDYCKWVCEKLQCCPFLFGPDLVGDPCPRKCSILAKVHWQQKKKFPNWRSKKFVDILKNLHAETASEASNNANSTGITESIENSDEDFYEPEVASSETINNENIGPDFSLPLNRDLPPVINDESKVEDSSEPMKMKRRSPLDAVKEAKKDSPEDLVKKKRGRPRKYPKQAPNELVYNSVSEDKIEEIVPSSPTVFQFPDLRIIQIESNPKLWGVKEIWRFIKSTDCSCLADRLLSQEVDGPSFMLLNLSTVLDYITANVSLALRLCYLVGCLKLTYYTSYEMQQHSVT